MNDERVAMLRVVTSYSDRLLPGERAMQYCTDVAGCECSTHTYMQIPCTVVGTTAARNARAGQGVDRCLVCSTAWVHRLRRSDPLVFVRELSEGTSSKEAA